MTNDRPDNLLQIHDSYIQLPSGRQLTLDCQKAFTPDREFWDLWKQRKLDLKRAGVFVTREETEYRGYVRSAEQGFSYNQADLHAYWISQAEKMAETEACEPVIVNAKDLGSDVPKPCHSHSEYRVLAKRCVNGTYQLRLRCEKCAVKTPGAIAWEKLGSDVVIPAIALVIQERVVLNNIDWV